MVVGYEEIINKIDLKSLFLKYIAVQKKVDREMMFLQYMDETPVKEALLLYEKIKDDLSDSIKKNKSVVAIPASKLFESFGVLALDILNDAETYELFTKFMEYILDWRFHSAYPINVTIAKLPAEEEEDPKRRAFTKEIRLINKSMLNRVIQIPAIVVATTENYIHVASIKYRHEKCGYEFEVPQGPFTKEKPKICPKCGESGKFIEVEYKKTNGKKLLLSDLPENLKVGKPGVIMALMYRDYLFDPYNEVNVYPGMRAYIVGIVKSAKKEKEKEEQLYIDVLWIEPLEEKKIELTDKDKEQLKNMLPEGDVIKFIADTMFPNIYGTQYSFIKQAILLAIVSGYDKIDDNIKKYYKLDRLNIHVLMVGGPGTGKSTILERVVRLVPRSSYITLTTATTTGLTASVRKDPVLGDWVLEVGAIPLVANGVACIDEIDKIPKQEITKLHEVMEQQTITIHKANIHTLIESPVSIIAAANPKFGKWDIHQDILAQIDLPQTILDRFDLIFAIIPEQQEMKVIGKEIIRNVNISETPTIDDQTLTKYIVYARSIIPEWTDPAIGELDKLYEELSSKPGIYITTRQINTIVRLAIASAKARLSKYITEWDVQKAKEIYLSSLYSIGVDPFTHQVDITIKETGFSRSEATLAQLVVDSIKELEKDFPNGVPISEIVNSIKNKNVDVDEESVKYIIEKLKKVGEVYESGENKVKRIVKS
ncbi:MAG: ATP-binding protein [Nanopusillaceae archaeon]